MECRARRPSIEYDPNRTARIALIKYPDGDWRYILAPNGLRVGDRVESGEQAEIRVGNAIPLRAMPAGTMVHNVEMSWARADRSSAAPEARPSYSPREGKYTLLRLPSGEVRYVLSECMATVGRVSAVDKKNVKLGKAAGVETWAKAFGPRCGHVAQRPFPTAVARAGLP